MPLQCNGRKIMDLSGIKLVVVDMDGTLLNSRHEVSHRFFDLYDELRNKDVLFAAASGRQYDSIIDKLQPLGKEITVIAENGGFAVHRGKEFVSTPLERHHKDLILKELDAINDVHPVLCSKFAAFLSPRSELFLEQLAEYYTHFQVIDNLSDFEGEVMKIAVYHDLGSEAHIYPYVKHLEGELKVKVSGECWVDVSHPNANKGYALNILQQKLKISPAETLVFGDYNNDLEMLALSEFSFAMANAHPNVIKAAKYQTLSNDAMGVEKVLEEVLQSKS